MPKIVKIGNVNLHCLTSYEADRLYNVVLGRNGRIHTNGILRKTPRLNQFINNETMGALDNYAKHENMNIYITPIENDMFNDIKVAVFKKGHEDVYFPMNVSETKEGARDFFKELYTKIHNATHPAEETKFAPKTKPSKWEDFKMYLKNVADRYNDARLSILKKLGD